MVPKVREADDRGLQYSAEEQLLFLEISRLIRYCIGQFPFPASLGLEPRGALLFPYSIEENDIR